MVLLNDSHVLSCAARRWPLNLQYVWWNLLTMLKAIGQSRGTLLSAEALDIVNAVESETCPDLCSHPVLA